MRVLVIGAGGHGRVVADILRAMAHTEPRIEFAGFLDDKAPFGNGAIVGPLSALPKVPHDAVVVAIGNNQTRERISKQLRSAGERLACVTHPSCIVAGDVFTGEGTMFCAGSIACTGAGVGHGVILNTGCSIDHHTRIGHYAHVAPGVRIGGEVSIGDRVLLGIGAIVLPRITIGHDAIVGAGAVVTRDVAPNMTVTGIPARPVNYRPRLAVAGRGHR